ncbi:MAG: hypothetical protein JWN02_2069 [Acidobacteria bacterium]|nr:hypothetical protein [Acidobacteriota bacterium]
MQFVDPYHVRRSHGSTAAEPSRGTGLEPVQISDLVYRLPLRSYPGMSRFVLDWLDADPRATRLLPRRAGEVPEPRLRTRGTAELVEALIASNKRWGSFVGDDVRRWAAGESIALVAGQQVGFAGGPLYTIAKIATLVKMKRELEAAGKPATIFFWLATEDHDFAEAATLQLPVSSVPAAQRDVNRQLDLVRLRATRGVNDKSIVGPQPVPEALIAGLLALYGMPRPAWLREGITFGDSFAELLAGVFEEKIVFVDALLPELRRAGTPFFEQLFARYDEVQRLLARIASEIAAAGYTPQVLPREGEDYTLLFRLDGHGNRELIAAPEPVGDPATLSTSALTRPLLQDFVIAPDVFVGGPAEVSYYAQLLPVHELLGITPPRVALRGHVLAGAKRVVRCLSRFQIDPRQIFSDADILLAEREPESVAEIEALAEQARRELGDKITRIGELALPAEHALARAINRSIGHLEYHFNKLTERAVRGVVRKDRERYGAVRELVATFYPDRHVQDRVVGWFHLWHQLGRYFVDRMIEEVEPDAAVFKIVGV